MRTCLILCCLLLGIVSLQAQDKIYKKDGQIISAKVTEVGVDEIKYLLHEEITGPVYVIEKILLIKIVFANGRVETYHQQ